MMILPLLVGITLKVLYTPPSEGVEITGAMIFLRWDDMPVMPLLITESEVNSWLVMISIFGLVLYLTHGLTEKAENKRQLAAEWIVEKVTDLVHGNMGEQYSMYIPFIAAIMGLSAFSSLSCLVGLFSPTGDVNVTAGWAILVFLLVTWYKLKGGVFNYLKGFTEPIPVFTPMNIVGEFSLPLSMAFRHYGNVLSGAVISVLVGVALKGLSNMILGWIPLIGDAQLLRIGIPAVLSVYFDVFSGLMQAFIFAMLTMLNIAGAFPEEAWQKRQEKKRLKQMKKAAANG